MKKRLLFVGNSFGHGGMTTAFLSLADFLEAHGYDVKVLLNYRVDQFTTAIPRRYVIGYAWRWKISNSFLRHLVKFFYCLVGWEVYFKFARRYRHDVLVVYGLIYDAIWVGYSKKPSIGFLHLKALTGGEKARFPYSLYSNSVHAWRQKCDVVAGVAPDVVEAGRRIFQLKSEPILLPNLFDMDSVVACAGEFNVPRTADACKIVCVARVAEQKGILRLIRAVHNAICHTNRKLHLQIIGGADAGYGESCEQLVRDLGIDGIIEFLGHKDNPFPYVKNADLLVLPSLNEGFGLVIWEALTLSVPVLVTDCGGTAYATNYGEWGRLVANSDDAFEKGLLEYLRDSHCCDPKCGFDAVHRRIRAIDKENRDHILSVFSGLVEKAHQVDD